MVLSFLNTHPEIILKLFNKIFSEGMQIAGWNIAIINPIHKKGSKFDPLNYRGISLLSCFSKFFTAVLNMRLLDFCLKNKILSEEQMGFIPGNRTSDAFIVLHNLINDYCHIKSKYIYGCFVDFTRAFDSVPRHKLFEKLIKYNITGKFYESIKNLYTNDLSCVKIGDKLTDTFENTQGVKQGCILSPLLFNIFLADLPKMFQHKNNLLKINENDTLSCVIWADDLLLLSDSQTGLNNMLGELCTYCDDNFIEVNTDKTKCMVFNKTGRHLRKSLLFGENKIDTGVQKQTTNAGVLLELGTWPLYINARKNCIKNWERIAVQKNVNHVTKTSYEWALKNSSGWAIKVKEYLAHIGLLEVFLELQNSADIKVFCREKDIFHQTEFFNIQQDSAKLRTYSMIKTKIGLEDYLISMHNIAERIAFSKFRLSNHRLLIEIGRHKKIEKQRRICPFCPLEIEDEIHFLTTCPTYNTIRENLFAELPTLSRTLYTDKFSLFKYLMINKNAVKHTAKFINSALSIREFLMANYRNDM